MRRLFSIGLLVLGLLPSLALAQMASDQGGRRGGMMGDGWGWGMGYGWGFGIIIVILVVFGAIYMIKRK